MDIRKKFYSEGGQETNMETLKAGLDGALSNLM